MMALITSRPSNPKLEALLPLDRLGNNNAVPLRRTVNTKPLTNHSNSTRRVRLVITASSGGEEKPRRIMLSDVSVKRPREVFSGRKWNGLDVGTAIVVLAMHLLALLAPFHFSRSALCVAFALYIVTGLFGITLSFHRNLSHRSFKLPKWLEYVFAYCGVLALQVSTSEYSYSYSSVTFRPRFRPGF